MELREKIAKIYEPYLAALSDTSEEEIVGTILLNQKKAEAGDLDAAEKVLVYSTIMLINAREEEHAK